MATANTSSSSSSSSSHGFEVFVSNDSFKFNAAHFVAFRGYRERLHGHNYRVSVRLRGSSHIGPDGYVLDFGCIKAVTRQVCKELNEHFLCPILSNVMTITTTTITTTTTTTASSDQPPPQQEQVRLECEDGSVFVFPKQDCVMLPLVHATTEELSIYLWGRLLEGLQSDYLRDRGIQSMEVTVSEAPNQEATFRHDIPVTSNAPPPAAEATALAEADGEEAINTTSTNSHLDVRNFIQNGDVIPMPCLATDKERFRAKPCTCCQQLSQNLQRLADAMNQKTIPHPWTVQDLEQMILNSSTESSSDL
jgi:6-pyruvoyltetrahydropterin/6-carboxytetrahydropterin synthase